MAIIQYQIFRLLKYDCFVFFNYLRKSLAIIPESCPIHILGQPLLQSSEIAIILFFFSTIDKLLPVWEFNIHRITQYILLWMRFFSCSMLFRFIHTVIWSVAYDFLLMISILLHISVCLSSHQWWTSELFLVLGYSE